MAGKSAWDATAAAHKTGWLYSSRMLRYTQKGPLELLSRPLQEGLFSLSDLLFSLKSVSLLEFAFTGSEPRFPQGLPWLPNKRLLPTSVNNHVDEYNSLTALAPAHKIDMRGGAAW